MSNLDSLKTAWAAAGRLRASINLGNPILAARAPSATEPVGVSVDLARELARQLDLPLELVVFDTAGQSVAAVASGQADIGFFAIDPLRGADISFSPPYVLIEGCHAVREDAWLQSNDDVDRAGIRVVVGRGSAYDLHLTRELRQATIERAPSSQTVFETFVQSGADVASGVKQQLESDLMKWPGHRLLPGSFMVIRQAMGLHRNLGPQAAAALARFVENMKATGFVAQALKRHGIEGAAVAPPEQPG